MHLQQPDLIPFLLTILLQPPIVGFDEEKTAIRKTADRRYILELLFCLCKRDLESLPSFSW
jgi:hypothetical protein